MCADLLAETGLVYSQQDVCRHLFGHRPPPERPLPPPAPRPGTVAVWCDQPLAAHYGRPHEVFGRYLRERLRLPDPVTLVSPAAGYYRRRLVPDCFEQTFDEQRRWLRPGEGLAPAAVVATMLLTHVIAAWDRDPFDDLLTGDWVRCQEVDPLGDRLVIGGYHDVSEHYVVMRYHDSSMSSQLGLMACEPIPASGP